MVSRLVGGDMQELGVFEQKETITFYDLEAVGILIKVMPAQYLKPFFNKAHSLSEAAEILGVEINSYYYWIKKFLKLGLLKVAFEKKRAGSKMKFYQTPAKRIVLGLGKDLSLLSEYYMAANKAYCNDIVESKVEALAATDCDLAIVFQIDKQSELNTSIIMLSADGIEASIGEKMMEATMPAVYTGWYEMQLQFQDAKEFQKKLHDLMTEYRAKMKTGQGKYLVQMALVPLK